jgi:hypothetical protein
MISIPALIAIACLTGAIILGIILAVRLARNLREGNSPLAIMFFILAAIGLAAALILASTGLFEGFLS